MDDEGDLCEASFDKYVFLEIIFNLLLDGRTLIEREYVKDLMKRFSLMDQEILIYLKEEDVRKICAEIKPIDLNQMTQQKPGQIEKDRGWPLFCAAIYISEYQISHNDYPPIKDMADFLDEMRRNIRSSRPQAETTTIMRDYAEAKRLYSDIRAVTLKRLGEKSD